MDAYLRQADIDDAKMVLEWRNDPLARENSFTKELIDQETHMKWFRSKLSEENCFMYILMKDSEPVGQLRIDRIGEIGEISYMIAPDKRSRGFGKKILQLAERAAAGKVKALVGMVENFNGASVECFRVNNYSELGGGVLPAISRFCEYL